VFGMGTGVTLAVWSPANRGPQRACALGLKLEALGGLFEPAAEILSALREGPRPHLNLRAPGGRFPAAGPHSRLFLPESVSSKLAPQNEIDWCKSIRRLVESFLRTYGCAELILWTSRTGD
jgi:hypothetical protein